MAKVIAKDRSLGECLDVQCKDKQKRFGFCMEHYEQFKFGSIKKDGTRPSDYDVKMGHYARYKSKIMTKV